MQKHHVEQQITNFAKIMILNNDREQQIAKQDPEKKISKNANLQIQMT